MPTMPNLSWTDALALDMPEMDRIHHEFVVLLGDLERDLARGDSDVDGALARLLAHTEAHFAREEQWMALLGHGRDNAHAFQHQAVLNLLREARRLHTVDRDRERVRCLVADLAHWLAAHGEAMDRALADDLAEHGYDAAADALAVPAPAPARRGAASATDRTVSGEGPAARR